MLCASRSSGRVFTRRTPVDHSPTRSSRPKTQLPCGTVAEPLAVTAPATPGLTQSP
jgi:hypothetical protein